MKYDDKKIGKRINLKRKSLGLSQEALGKRIGTVGKQISNYENSVTTPPIDVMLKLCDVFDCELGYLLGEADYSKGTRIETAINKTTGLTIESMNALRMITGTESSCLNFGRDARTYRSLLNSLFSSPLFLTVIECLYDLDSAVSESNSIWTDLETRMGKDELDEAINLYKKYYGMCDVNSYELFLNEVKSHRVSKHTIDDSTEKEQIALLDLPELKLEQAEALSMFTTAIDKKYELNYTIKIARYELQEAFEALIQSLYPR